MADRQLSMPVGPVDLDVDHPRAALKAKRQHHVHDIPVVGFLFEELKPEPPPIRSKRLKVSMPRVGRQGDRPQSLGAAKLTREERWHLEHDEWELRAAGVTFGPPATFSDCPPGPCAHYGCRHHAGLEVDGDMIKVNFPHLDVDEIPETCTLRAAVSAEVAPEDLPLEERDAREFELGDAVRSCDEVGHFLNLATERVRQIENAAKRKFIRNWRRMFGSETE